MNKLIGLIFWLFDPTFRQLAKTKTRKGDTVEAKETVIHVLKKSKE